MHTVNIPEWVKERIIKKYDREHFYDDLDPAKTALVVVDMQNTFLLPEVAHALCPGATDIVPNINRLAKAVRETGGAVVWVTSAYDPNSIKEWASLYRMCGPERSAKRLNALTVGSKAHELWHELEVLPQDIRVTKNRFSAFLPTACNLAEVLRARGLDTVLITGTVTNVCCESTARDAMQMNFHTIMVTDGNAAVTDEEHNWSLINFYNSMGDIMSTDFLIGCLRRNMGKNLAAAE
jgi:ureidoacrylate peracid hydrolase